MVDLRNAPEVDAEPSRLALGWKRRFAAWAWRALVAIAGGLGVLHVAVLMMTASSPPSLAPPVATAVACSDQVCRTASSWADRRLPITTAHLAGCPASLGRDHAALLHDRMIATESALWSVFRRRIPVAPVRTLVLDIARLRFRDIDQRYPGARRLELASSALFLNPDPFASDIPTYQRSLYLNALYDVALSFEGSPLVGCTSVAVADPAARAPTLLARNFDFETHEVFDLGKAVIVFDEDRLIPVLSVAWPGLIGVVTGMNARGVGIVVHGARAGQPTRQGEPVPITVREALSVASSTEDAVSFIAQRPAMVSHMLLIADRHGRIAVMERVPEAPPFVRWGGSAVALTNHLEGPFAQAEPNLRVRASTSTLARRARADSLLAHLPHPPAPADLVALLRDRNDIDGNPLGQGDRRAIDAGIATHGVVMDLSNLRIWVSQGPHLDGAFLGFSLPALLLDPDIARADALGHVIPARPEP